MSITSAQGYEMRIARTGDKIGDPPEPYRQTVERLLADRAKVTVQGCNSPQISPGSQLKQAVRPGGLQRPDKIAPFGGTRDHRSRACSPW